MFITIIVFVRPVFCLSTTILALFWIAWLLPAGKEMPSALLTYVMLYLIPSLKFILRSYIFSYIVGNGMELYYIGFDHLFFISFSCPDFFFRRNVLTTSLIIITLFLAVLVVRQEQMPYTATSHPAASRRDRSGNSSKLVVGFSNVFGSVKPVQKPKTHIAFLKVHKAASSTVQNILYRYGLVHDLNFVLPFNGHYLSHDADKYNAIIPSPDKSGKYDIICNHAVFNRKKFKSLMHDDAFYLAIVRDPLQRFVSAAYYYRYRYHKPYLVRVNQSTFLHDLITYPLKYEPNFRDSRTFNRLAFDFGLPVSSVKKFMSLDEGTMNKFVSNLTEMFHFVMIVEKFDESLVMLKRFLNWSIKDILYIKRNEFRSKARKTNIEVTNITVDDEARFKLTNHLDYLIYNNFVERFHQQAAMEKDLEAEVKEFKRKLGLVEAFCIIDNTREEVLFWKTEFNGAFRVNRNDCTLMMTNELFFNGKLRRRQKLILYHTRSDNPRSKRSKYVNKQ